MKLLSKDTAHYTRFTNDAVSGGKWLEDGSFESGTPTEPKKFQCSIQPKTSGLTRALEAEGIREEDYEIIFTKTQLRSTSRILGTAADEVVINDTLYEVHSSKYWRGVRKLTHYEVVIVLKDRGT